MNGLVPRWTLAAPTSSATTSITSTPAPPITDQNPATSFTPSSSRRVTFQPTHPYAGPHASSPFAPGVAPTASRVSSPPHCSGSSQPTRSRSDVSGYATTEMRGSHAPRPKGDHVTLP